jgi:ribonuclease HI
MFRNYRILQISAATTVLSPDPSIPERLMLRLPFYHRPCTKSISQVSIPRYDNSAQCRLLHTDIESSIVEKMDAVLPVLNTRAAFSTVAALSKGEAIAYEKEHRGDGIAIYTDGSGAGEQVGAAAVMYRNGKFERCLQFNLGSKRKYTSYEGELVGVLLALHLVNTTELPREKVRIYTDNRAAVVSLLSKRKQNLQYLIDEIMATTEAISRYEARQTTEQLTNSHPPLTPTFVWVPSDHDIPGNKMAHNKAREAAQDYSNNLKDLPRKLRLLNWKAKLSSKTSIKKGGV